MTSSGWCLLDLDGTLTEDRTVERLAVHFGVEKQVRSALSPRGEPNAGIAESACVMRAFAGVDADEFAQVCGRHRFRPGARLAVAGVRSLGLQVMIASASYEPAAQAAADALGANAIAAVRPEIHGGLLTGRLHPSPWAGECGRAVCKAQVARRLEGPLLAVGDGANDVCMFRQADVAVALAPCHDDAAAAADVTIDQLALLPRVVEAMVAM